MGRAQADFDDFEAALDVALGVDDGLAVFTGQQLGQRIIFGLDQFQELAHDADAALRVHRAPGGLRRLGVFDGLAHLCRGRQRDLALDGAVHRLEDVRRLAALAGDMLAADEMSDFPHGSSLPDVSVDEMGGSWL